jgi:hypothetical protein
MEELATDMVFPERSSGTTLRTSISFSSVILTNRDAVVVYLEAQNLVFAVP